MFIASFGFVQVSLHVSLSFFLHTQHSGLTTVSLHPGYHRLLRRKSLIKNVKKKEKLITSRAHNMIL